MYQLVYLDKNGEDGVHVPLLAGGVSVERRAIVKPQLDSQIFI